MMLSQVPPDFSCPLKRCDDSEISLRCDKCQILFFKNISYKLFEQSTHNIVKAKEYYYGKSNGYNPKMSKSSQMVFEHYKPENPKSIYFYTLTLDPKLFHYADCDRDREHQYRFFQHHLNEISLKVDPLLIYGCSERHASPNDNIHFHFIVYYQNCYKSDNHTLLKYLRSHFCVSQNNRVCIQPGPFREVKSIRYINKDEHDKLYAKRFYLWCNYNFHEDLPLIPQSSPLDNEYESDLDS
jgi:hypothetical protein